MGRAQPNSQTAAYHVRVRAHYLPQSAIDRGRRVAAAVFRHTTDGLRALLHGDADSTGATPSHPQSSALPLLSRRSARGLAAARPAALSLGRICAAGNTYSSSSPATRFILRG